MAGNTMRAVVFKGVGEVAVEDRAVPRIQSPNDAILKVQVAALCGSDLHWYRGKMNLPTGFIPGHEFVGVVHELGSSVKTVKPGDLVVASFSTQCGSCFYCLKGQTSSCEKSFLFGNSAETIGIDGGQAEYVRVPDADFTLVQAPQGIMKNSLLLMGDIFPTGYYCASRHLESMPTSEQESCVVAVVGCGPVGICAIAAASTWSKNIFAIDVIPDRLAEAKRIGAKPLMLNENPVAAIQAATQGRGADVVLELVGSSDAMNLCINIARQYGKISSIGLQTGPRTFDGSALYLKNLTISWGRCPVRGIFEDALACLLKVQDKVKFLCDRKVSIEDAIEAYELFNAGKVHKILVVP